MTTEPIVFYNLVKLYIGPGIVLILPLVYFIFYLSLSVSLVSYKFPHLYSTHTHYELLWMLSILFIDNQLFEFHDICLEVQTVQGI